MGGATRGGARRSCSPQGNPLSPQSWRRPVLLASLQGGKATSQPDASRWANAIAKLSPAARRPAEPRLLHCSGPRAQKPEILRLAGHGARPTRGQQRLGAAATRSTARERARPHARPHATTRPTARDHTLDHAWLQARPWQPRERWLRGSPESGGCVADSRLGPSDPRPAPAPHNLTDAVLRPRPGTPRRFFRITDLAMTQCRQSGPVTPSDSDQ